MQRLDSFAWKHRNILAGLPLGVMLVSTRWETEADGVIWPIAIALCALGVALRSWASCHCWYAQGRPMTLTSSGPYAYVRNPLYVANILIITSAAVASELEWLVPAALLWAALVYARVARYEEDQLLREYGESFLRYQAEVPGWLPRTLRPPGPTGERQIGSAAVRQALNSLVLAPFLLKELNVFGLWTP
ncbi:MAG TPA: isoprenylcysteine carboxylmethyltransferase family protein [Vicinamibacterales bacterium]|nr:isoprenylcysteine carboxylmethyltransferase family protein [Vicinamibacterales bacterium]